MLGQFCRGSLFNQFQILFPRSSPSCLSESNILCASSAGMHLAALATAFAVQWKFCGKQAVCQMFFACQITWYGAGTITA